MAAAIDITKRLVWGMRYIGPRLRSVPGTVERWTSAHRSERPTGTRAPSRWTSLLPVPFMPKTSQLASSMRKAAFGTSTSRISFVPASVGASTRTAAQSQTSTPEA